jgi:U5 small nuclear ribonucleoprotein component
VPVAYRLSPELGNVAFASGEDGWCFTLLSFAKIYSETSGGGFKPEEFAKRLWGDVYLHKDRSFKRRPAEDDRSAQRTFVQFILEPLYKIYSHVVGESPHTLQAALEALGIRLRKEECMMDSKPLLRLVLSQFFGNHANALAHMCVSQLPSPDVASRRKVEGFYTGPQNSTIAKAMSECDPKGPLMINVTKLYSTPDARGFDSFGRVFSGTLRRGQQVKVLGEGYTMDDEEDMSVQTVTRLWIYQSRYRLEVDEAHPGDWVLIEGVDTSIVKTATITGVGVEAPYIFKPLAFNTISVVKVAVV